MTFHLFTTLWLSVLTSAGVAIRPQPTAGYLDTLVLKDVGDGRQFEVVGNYRYVDSRGVEWKVPGGVKVNGASIPRYLWSIVGGPWEGNYRNASVIHDYFYDQHEYASDEIHWVFYDAMRKSDVGIVKAKLMYWAVLRFNPRWEAVTYEKQPCPPTSSRRCLPVLADEAGTYVRFQLVTPRFDEAELKKAAALIERNNPADEEIRDSALAQRTLAHR